MDPKSSPDNPIDLSSLEGFTLGTAWSESQANKNAPAEGRSYERRAPREGFERREGGPRRPFGRDGNQGGRPPFRPGEPRRDHHFQRQERPAPIVPPSIKVVFYPEEATLKALVKAVKASKRTYELFEISRLLLEKPERAAATLTHKDEVEGKPKPLYQTVDGAVFLTEGEALAHATTASLDKFFKVEEVEIEAPKGNFVVIHRCTITGKLIAPPNYHRYAQLLAEHHAKHLPHMALAAVQAKLESVKEPEAIAQWLESMKKTTRYTLLNVAEGQPAVSFDGPEAAAAHLAQNFKDQLVKPQGQVRLSGKQVETLPTGEIKRSIEASRAWQMKFPLDTANALRGRLRRMGFNIYKRGQKGVSYICAVKRRFRAMGQTFAPEVQQVIEFIEKNPNITDVDLPKQMLGISLPAAVKDAPAPQLPPEEDKALRQLRQTLGWLIEQGYVIQFGSGVLFVPPARSPNAPKEEGEDEAAAVEEKTDEKAEEKPAEPTSESPAEAPKEEPPAAPAG